MTYQYHSTIFNADVEISYNKNGFLRSFTVMSGDVDGVNTEKDTIPRLYYRERDFLTSAKEHKLQLREVDRVVSFEMFWDAYKQKDCGRTKAEHVWNKMSKAEQVEAFDFIPAMNSILRNSGTAKPYATTYLNQKRWIR